MMTVLARYDYDCNLKVYGEIANSFSMFKCKIKKKISSI